MNENEYSFDTPSAPQTNEAAARPQETPYQAAPQARPVYSYQQPYQRPAYAYPQQTRAVRQEQPKKKRMTLRVAVVALCCAILGSLIGGGAVGLVMHQMMMQS